MFVLTFDCFIICHGRSGISISLNVGLFFLQYCKSGSCRVLAPPCRFWGDSKCVYFVRILSYQWTLLLHLIFRIRSHTCMSNLCWFSPIVTHYSCPSRTGPVGFIVIDYSFWSGGQSRYLLLCVSGVWEIQGQCAGIWWRSSCCVPSGWKVGGLSKPSPASPFYGSITAFMRTWPSDLTSTPKSHIFSFGH